MAKEHCEPFKLAKTLSGCCSKCLKLDATIKTLNEDITNIQNSNHIDVVMESVLVERKRKLKKVVKEEIDHHQSSKKERDFYTNRKNWLQAERVNNRLVLSELYRTYRSNVLHLSIDAMQNKKYPTFTRYKEPAVYYFIKKITLHLLGVVDEGSKK